MTIERGGMFHSITRMAHAITVAVAATATDGQWFRRKCFGDMRKAITEARCGPIVLRRRVAAGAEPDVKSQSKRLLRKRGRAVQYKGTRSAASETASSVSRWDDSRAFS